MRVAVIGGGLMGCSAALALAESGARVVLFEREDCLLQRTAIAGEGKIHLGYVYGNDGSLATARMMIAGALAFAPFYRRFLGSSFDFGVSAPFFYPVHRDSILTVEEVASHFSRVHTVLREGAAGANQSYFGIDLRAPHKRISSSAIAERFEPAAISAVFRTPEIAIRPAALARAIAERIKADPAIELRLGFNVSAVETARCGLTVAGYCQERMEAERFDHVVNAAWDGRLAIDQNMAMLPSRPWLFRLKYGIRLPPNSSPAGAVSATFVLGPFGDVVRYPDGSLYLSWYPACLRSRSRRIVPPRWRGKLPRGKRNALVQASFAALSRLMPGLSGLSQDRLNAASVRGAAVFAWGCSDIDDPSSELHRRADIGLSGRERYHSIDPGKLTMVPFFAERCAAQVFG